jgi:hypothetical protein
MSSNKKRDMVASDDDDEYDEDYEGKSRLDDELLRKIGMLGHKATLKPNASMIHELEKMCTRCEGWVWN